MAPLAHYVESLRPELVIDLLIPYFDSADEGANAEALFMLEAPGPRAEDLVSCGYSYATAENIRKFPEQVGLARERVVLWNIVFHSCV